MNVEFASRQMDQSVAIVSAFQTAVAGKKS
jgi:hypothetical protein